MNAFDALILGLLILMIVLIGIFIFVMLRGPRPTVSRLSAVAYSDRIFLFPKARTDL